MYQVFRLVTIKKKSLFYTMDLKSTHIAKHQNLECGGCLTLGIQKSL